MKPQLILCDFDGTLTKQDTMIRFFVFACGGWFWFILKLIPFAIWMPFYWHYYGRTKAKSRAYIYFIGKKHRSKLLQMGRIFSKKHLPKLIRADLYSQLKNFQKQREKVVIVSASLEWWLWPFCLDENFALICTMPKYDTNGYFIGEFATENCKYEEKVRRVEAMYKRSNFSKVIAFGNSSGDSAMLDWANESHWFGRVHRIFPEGKDKS